MSRSIEDRLAAALEARAEQVTPENLGPVELPGPARGPRFGLGTGHPRRGTVLLLAAAASAIIVVTPFLLSHLNESGSEPAPAGTPPAGAPEPTRSTPPSTSPSGPTDTVVTGRQRADVDGDGRPDQVRVLLHSASADEPALGSVEVTLASGTTSSAAVPFGYAPDLEPPFSLNGDGREQVLLSHTAGGDEAALLVYTWYEGRLVAAQMQSNAPLALGLDGQGRMYDYYTDDRGLVSWLRLGQTTTADGRTFKVREWVWRLVGSRLAAERAGIGCVDVTTNDSPGRCAGSAG